jgi:6-pyruvoyltetrahydropterin/6-carboxytetrahydropterin synthase
MIEIYEELTFEAAHLLPNVPEGHKCARLHGHSYRVRVTVAGEVGADSGWVMDFAEIRAVTEPVRLELDHYYLNEIDGLENPTAENLARWIWDRLVVAGLAGLHAVEVSETCTAGAIYRGS